MSLIDYWFFVSSRSTWHTTRRKIAPISIVNDFSYSQTISYLQLKKENQRAHKWWLKNKKLSTLFINHRNILIPQNSPCLPYFELPNFFSIDLQKRKWFIFNMWLYCFKNSFLQWLAYLILKSYFQGNGTSNKLCKHLSSVP